MSAAEQLELGALGTPKRKKNAREEMCRCGCELVGHAGKKHRGPCSRCGTCKRGNPMKKPPIEQPAHLAPPNGAIILERDKAKRAPWTIGWAVVREIVGDGIDAFNGVGGATGLHAILYLAQFKTRSLNKNFFGGVKDDPNAGKKIRQRYAWQTHYVEQCQERAMSAILQCDLQGRGRPSEIVMTRVCGGTLDKHDNVRGAMKHIVDGIAEALGFNDAELDDSPARAGGTIGIRYAQEKCPPKVCGVRIEITWRST